MDTALRDEIVAHLLASIEGAPLVTKPFAHINFTSAFPERLYAAMLASLPPDDLYQPADNDKYMRPDGQCSRQVLDLLPALDRLPSGSRSLWEAVHAALASDALRRSVCARLRVAEKGFPVPRLVHDLPGYWIEPHPDSRAKHVTMQFYLAPDAGHEELGTVLYRLSPFRKAVWLRREHVMQRVGQFPFRPNSGYAFGVRWNSFHGVERIADASGERHTLMNIYYHREQPQQ
jgi:hypothetical protein